MRTGLCLLHRQFLKFFVSTGRDANLVWVPRIEEAASYCRFYARPERSNPTTTAEQRNPAHGNISHISFHTDPDGHVNIASCPVPAWVLDAAPHDGASNFQVDLVLRLWQQPCTAPPPFQMEASSNYRAISRSDGPLLYFKRRRWRGRGSLSLNPGVTFILAICSKQPPALPWLPAAGPLGRSP